MSTVPCDTEENHSSAPAYASLSESTGIVTRQAFFLSEVTKVGCEKHAMEIFWGCPICPTLLLFSATDCTLLLSCYQAKHHVVFQSYTY